jgi:hypothetical protein
VPRAKPEAADRPLARKAAGRKLWQCDDQITAEPQKPSTAAPRSGPEADGGAELEHSTTVVRPGGDRGKQPTPGTPISRRRLRRLPHELRCERSRAARASSKSISALSSQARPSLQPGQTKPCGQRRSKRYAAHALSLAKRPWNSLNDFGNRLSDPDMASPRASRR